MMEVGGFICGRGQFGFVVFVSVVGACVFRGAGVRFFRVIGSFLRFFVGFFFWRGFFLLDTVFGG